MRLYCVGGLATVALGVTTPVIWGQAVILTATQYFLVAIGALLIGLAIVRSGIRRRSNRARRSTLDYCQKENIELSALVTAAQQHEELYFFTALWDGHEVDNL